MAGFKLTFSDLGSGRNFVIGESHEIEATIGQGHLIEMEDIHFHHDSAVLLADPKCEESESVPVEERITGLSVLATCLKHAQGHSRELLLLAGHADTSGDAQYNVGLSERRAQNVLFALTGDREKWAHSSDEKYQVEDYQAILAWIDARFGFGTDPQESDNKHGPGTDKALRAFQKRYNSDFGASIAVDGEIGLETWRAFFDMYMLALQDICGTDADGLSDLRKSLTFLDGKRLTVGCGENHPIEAADKDDFRSKTNRRVELLFFDPKARTPKLDCHPAAGKCSSKVCEIYGKGFFAFNHIPCGAATAGFTGEFAAGEPVEPVPGEAPPQQPDDPDPTVPRGDARLTPDPEIT